MHSIGEQLNLPFFALLLDKRIGLMVNFAKKKGQVAACPRVTNIRGDYLVCRHFYATMPSTNLSILIFIEIIEFK